jgi:hypothetical protein
MRYFAVLLTAHELQLTENNLFLPFKLNWAEALDNYRHKNSGK